ncbi:MAG: DUF1349 domain-containing protein [Pirellulales bacterium]
MFSEEIPGWGFTIDPSSDCPIDLTKDGIQIIIPGGRYDMNAEFENTVAPRVLQDVQGDFVIEVAVIDFPMPKELTSAGPPQKSSYIAAGLLVWQDQKNFIRWTRSAVGEVKKVFASAEIYQDGSRTGSLNIEIPDTSVWLRIERRGDRISYWISADKQTWKRVAEKKAELKSTVKAGVFSMNVTKAETKFGFERFYVLSSDQNMSK